MSLKDKLDELQGGIVNRIGYLAYDESINILIDTDNGEQKYLCIMVGLHETLNVQVWDA